MVIVQDAFAIPDDIATGLATGLYKRCGSAIRYATGPKKGRYVKFLDSVDVKDTEKAMGIGEKALYFIKDHKKGAFITVAVATTVGAGTLIYKKVKNHEPKVVTEFREALRIYVDAIRKGRMNLDKIDNLMDAMEAMKKHKDYEKISIQLTAEEMEGLVAHIYEYTIKLAHDNDVELSEEELNTAEMKNSGTIINLQNYLRAQRRIFSVVA